MTQHVSDVMTRAPLTVEPQTSVAVVARMMRDEDIGAVLVTEGERLRGLVSDRDLVVRAWPGAAIRTARPWRTRAATIWSR
jgi:CBS domain-containing protein